MALANNNLISVKANLRSRLSALRGRSQNQAVVSFWIITMMLVLLGLATLKLR
jgi:UDP-N-acetylmuramyl pentapeptide phosphotransferase/UDP-N-acetylglucosamine-1-phosphate transferase